MTIPRQNTIYDLTSLRLHPDGTRAQNNRKLRVSKQSVRDIQGNWIANDAGGSGRVTRYRTLRGKRAESGGVEDSGENEQQSEPGEKPTIKDYRAIKRRKFKHDFDFTSPSPIHQYAGSQEEEDPVLPLPSSDLLKCIHFMASQYYHERGQLLNTSREYRRQKKLRRLAKLSCKISDRSEEESGDGPRSSSESGQRVSGDEVDEDEVESSDDMNEGKPGGKTKKKQKRGDRHPVIDMYQTMNGSALMALGMLVQEHIAEILKPRVPDDWEAGLEIFESDTEETEEIQIEKDLEAASEAEGEVLLDTQATLVEGNPSRSKSFNEGEKPDDDSDSSEG